MTFVQALIAGVERLPLPDWLTRLGIFVLVRRTRRKLKATDAAVERAFVERMSDDPIAEHAEAANAQHYEVPADFFAHCLGPRRKYSCCYYDRATTTLAEAEETALALTCEHAQIADGQHILELGCGWGSLTLWMASRYPASRIVAVSNSQSQRAHILSEANGKNLDNLTVLTADMNDFDIDTRFDRIVSVEMFEHMANWRLLLRRTRRWLTSDGRLFLHVFTHEGTSYRFDHRDKEDWIAQHFFTGGLMPSRTLIEHFDDLYRLEASWQWNGQHYARTARDWLTNCDAHRLEIQPVLAEVYSRRAGLWLRRWRLFFLATRGLFGHDRGRTWGVTHYLLAPSR